MTTATEHRRGSDGTDLRSLAVELKRESEASMVSASQLIEKLRNATSAQEVIVAQTLYMQNSFENYAQLSRLFSDLLMAMPLVESKASKRPNRSMERRGSALNARFKLLSQEADRGATEIITGLSKEERRKALFNVGE